MPKPPTTTGADCSHRTNLPLVEGSTFVDLLANLGEETTSKLLQEFLEDTGQRCQRLATALDANDRVTVSNEAHSVKGAAASFGATRLCEIASELEREAANGSIKQLRALTTALKIAEQPTAEEFKRRLAGL
jgi:HPt (histidine-containing phosphotransfer) domain-containing protein